MAFVALGPARSSTVVPRSFITHNRAKPLKHLLTTKSINSDDVDSLCEAAQAFEHGDLSATTAAGKTVALLFFQPSTRTRMGFEAATVALGAHSIGMDDMSGSRSNARSRETLEDCAAVISRLCDAIVVRHHEDGAAELMAAKSGKPVINAGDGWNEHPTQALIDIFALRRGLGTVRGKSIAIGGDPRGRTVRSLIGLLRYEGPREIVFCPPSHREVPGDILSAIDENQIHRRMVFDIKFALTDCDAIMMAPYDMSDIGEPADSGYTSPCETPPSYIITPEKIELTGSRALLYHPLPRQDEIHPACDDLPNAMYFEQVRLSKFMRMAVLERMLCTGAATQSGDG
jgi:aspartate carbamoyltransferase catalytic subunit